MFLLKLLQNSGYPFYSNDGVPKRNCYLEIMRMNPKLLLKAKKQGNEPDILINYTKDVKLTEYTCIIDQ